MSREKVDEINSILRGEMGVEDEKQYFGLRNVNERIKLKFGPDYGLYLDSDIGAGTKATIKIGVIKNDGD